MDNVLFGAMLHAADRLRQGQEATDFEEQLLGVLRAELSDEEIKDWGRVYREAVAARSGEVRGVPAAITCRPVSEGYSLADWMKEAGTRGEECMTLSNTSQIDPEALEAGEDFDSPEFIEGMRDWGFGVTVPVLRGGSAGSQAVQDTAGADERDTQPIHFRLEFENFHVHRAVGDGWPTTRDEIRWLCGSSSEMRPGSAFHSQEFGGGTAQAGQTPAFHLWNRTPYNGAARIGLVLNIECWEWDTGGAGGNPRHRQSSDPAQQQHPDQFDLVDDHLAPPGRCRSPVRHREYGVDPARPGRAKRPVCRRTILLDRNTLGRLSHRGTDEWHFNGDGHHLLRVKYTGDRVPFPAGTLEYAVRTGNSWSAPVSLPFESMTAPALASYHGKLYALYVRPSDQAVMWTRMEGQNWRTPQATGGDLSYWAPALAVAHGRLSYAITGTNKTPYWRTFNEATSSWIPSTTFDGSASDLAPALASEYSGRLWMTHVGTDGRLYLNTHDGREWSRRYENNLRWSVDSPVAMAPYNGQLWRIARGMDHKVYTSTSPGGAEWTNRGNPSNWKTTHGPALAAHDNRMWIFLRGTDGGLWTASYQTGWGGISRIAGSPMDEPTAASHDGKLYVMYRR